MRLVFFVERYGHTTSLFCVGGKTADLFEKCTHNLENNPTITSDKKKFSELDTFVNAMKKMTVKPGECHIGLTMLQLMKNTFFDGFFEPMVIKLAWKRIRQDCCDCYVQA